MRRPPRDYGEMTRAAATVGGGPDVFDATDWALILTVGAASLLSLWFSIAAIRRFIA